METRFSYMEHLGRTNGTHVRPAVTGEPSVSVIVTCYNQASFLPDSIESVRQQRHKAELILVDDGSTDDTSSVVSQFDDVRYIRQNNQGVSVARNTGFKASTSEYLIFLDADDRLLPTAIEDGLECFRGNPSSGFVVGRYRKINAEGVSISPPNQVCGDRDFYSALLKSNVVGMLSAVLFRRAALEEVGSFDPRFRASEDYDIELRVARSFAVKEHSNLVAEYRWHDHNMSLDNILMLQDALAALRAQWPHVKGDVTYREDFKTGVRNWRRHYTSLIFSDITKEMQAGGFPVNSLRLLLRMAGSTPGAIPAFARRTFEYISTVSALRNRG